MILCNKCGLLKPEEAFYGRGDSTHNRKRHVKSTCKRCMLDRMRDRAYGLQPGEYNQMLQDQDNTCASCGTTDPMGRGQFHVDHDHATGAVRGLLCHNCNIALGNLQDDPEIVEKLLRYITFHKECSE